MKPWDDPLLRKLSIKSSLYSGACFESWMTRLGPPLPTSQTERFLGSKIGQVHGVCKLES